MQRLLRNEYGDGVFMKRIIIIIILLIILIIIGGVGYFVYDDMKQVTLFSMGIIDNFEKRKGAVARKNLLDLATKVPSVYIKGAISDLGNTLFSSKSAPESVKLEYMQEKVNEISEGAYMTEFFDFRMKRFKRIDPRKIDYIEIQRQSIRNNDDKMILLNYIYTNLDRINYYLAILDNPEYAKK